MKNILIIIALECMAVLATACTSSNSNKESICIDTIDLHYEWTLDMNKVDNNYYEWDYYMNLRTSIDNSPCWTEYKVIVINKKQHDFIANLQETIDRPVAKKIIEDKFCLIDNGNHFILIEK